jgi:hypothetical protein
MQNPEIKNLAMINYEQLQVQLDDVLPLFEDVYSIIKGFYESLPWHTQSI